MECRIGCAACCIVVSISSSMPGMPNGKPAGVRCINLTPSNMCSIFGKSERPKVCSSLAPSFEMCGNDNKYAFDYLEKMEVATRP